MTEDLSAATPESHQIRIWRSWLQSQFAVRYCTPGRLLREVLETTTKDERSVALATAQNISSTMGGIVKEPEQQQHQIQEKREEEGEEEGEEEEEEEEEVREAVTAQHTDDE
eukprot:GHVU01197209.1.p1 GENE.GHVU01197209.1~~GHVU01197209.1.p1  ORF type:complete len:112 (+),score=39.26 GHVU01197209.1:284-619(+)